MNRLNTTNKRRNLLYDLFPIIVIGVLAMLFIGCSQNGGESPLQPGPPGVERGSEGSMHPYAAGNAAPRVGNAPLAVHFYDDGSFDPDGYIVKWEWNFGVNEGYVDCTATLGEADYEYESNGIRSVHLRITDDAGNYHITQFNIFIVDDTRHVPVAVPGSDYRAGHPDFTVNFFDAGSIDPDEGEIVKWEWDFNEPHNGEGGYHDFTSTQGSAAHTFQVANRIRTVKLRVTDDDWHQHVTNHLIYVNNGANARPIAVATADPLEGYAPLDVGFSSAGSYDPEDDPLSFEWDFVYDGEFTVDSEEQNPSHIYEEEGIYQAQLRVTDAGGSTDMLDLPLIITVEAQSIDSWQFAYTSNRDGNYEIYLADVQGSFEERLTNNASTDYMCDFSPDGSILYFNTDRDGNSEIYAMDMVTRDLTNITHDSGTQYGCAVSPSGEWILTVQSWSTLNKDIFRLRADGSMDRSEWINLTNTPGIYEHEMDWSPDGESVVYYKIGGGNDIWMMNALDGSNQHKVLAAPGDDHGPTFHPDGDKILYNSNRSGNADIFYYSISEGIDYSYINSGLYERGGDFSPDGEYVIFMIGEPSDVYYATFPALEPGEPIPLITSPGHDSQAAWRPMPD
jgi:PKD repeat protein